MPKPKEELLFFPILPPPYRKSDFQPMRADSNQAITIRIPGHLLTPELLKTLKPKRKTRKPKRKRHP